MAVDSEKNLNLWTVREKAIRMETEWLGYTLEKLPGSKTNGADRGGYRILNGDEVVQGEKFGISLEEVEQLVKKERTGITDRLSSDASRTEKMFQARLHERNADIFRERQRMIGEYLDMVHERLQTVKIFINVIHARLQRMDRHTREISKRMEIIYLNEQILSLDAQQGDTDGLAKLRDQLEFEIEEAKTREEGGTNFSGKKS